VDVGGGSPARLEQRARRMVRDALVGCLGADAPREIQYEARLARPEGGYEPRLYVSLRTVEGAAPLAEAIDLRQVFAGESLRGLVDGAVRSLLQRAGLLDVRGGWAAPRPRPVSNGGASGE
jgi:hypothetical protein